MTLRNQDCSEYKPNPDWMEDGNACENCGCGPDTHVQDGNDKIMAAEMSYLDKAIDRANTHGVLREFIYSYGEARFSGDNIPTAVNHALREWDL